MKEEMLLKNRLSMENYKLSWCIILIYLSLNISLVLFLFHPTFLDTQKFAIYHFHERPKYFKVLTYLFISIFFSTLTYVQCYALCCIFYGALAVQVLNYKLLDYIEQNLCKSYRGMDIIGLENMQNVIFAHLKKCARMHLHLRG